MSFVRKRVGGRMYVYATHYIGKDGKRSRVRFCYLGPKDEYRYVSMLHEKEGLVLRGLMNDMRVLEYLDAIISYVSSSDIDLRLREEIFRRVEKISKALKVDLCGER